MPVGLSIDASGNITGTPTAGGTFHFTVQATDSSTGAGPYAGSQAVTLTVDAPTITLSPGTLPDGLLSVAYSQQLTASGGTAPYTNFRVTSGTLPPGLTLSTAGLLSGKATAIGSFSFTVTATDSSTGTGPYDGSQLYSLRVTAADSFPNPGPLGSPWTTTAGTFTVANNQATAARTTAASLAVLDSAALANVTESVSVTNLKPQQLAALVARDQGAGTRNLYYAGIRNTGGTVTAEIGRYLNGKLTKLATGKVAALVAGFSPAGTNTITFEAVGPSLRLFVNGTLIVSATDLTFTTGSLGLRGTMGATFANYGAAGVALLNPTLPFADAFSPQPSDGQLSTNWTDVAGDFTVNGSGQAVAVNSVPVDIAVLNGATAADVTLSANVSSLAVGQMAALVARYQDNGTMYYAGVANVHGVATAEIWRVVRGVRKRLGSTVLPSFNGGVMKLQVTGMVLTLTVGATTLLAADGSITAAGQVGIRGTAGAQFAGFGAG